MPVNLSAPVASHLQAVPGVLNVLLVYHHAEPAHALDEALPSLSILSATGEAHEHTS